MKVIIVALAVMAVVAAIPVEKEPPKILRSDFENTANGYVYSFETENGIKRVEDGQIKETFDEENKPHNVVVVRGSFSYLNDQGKEETITYYADETGYHPDGDSIPKPTRR